MFFFPVLDVTRHQLIVRVFLESLRTNIYYNRWSNEVLQGDFSSAYFVYVQASWCLDVRPAVVGGVEVIHDNVRPVSCDVRKIHLCHIERCHSWPAESLVAKRIYTSYPATIPLRENKGETNWNFCTIYLLKIRKT